jgi:DNA polymerase-4
LQIATSLRAAVRDRVGLAITVGVAPTKFLAKVASGVAKPDGLLIVAPGAELDFLHPLPVERLWGVGRVTGAKLRERGVLTVGDVADLSEPALVAMLGRAGGRHLHALAHNRDPRPVDVRRRRRSIGSQRAMGLRRLSLPDIDAALVGLVDRVCRRLRTAERMCRTVVLRLRFNDFSRITRSHTLPSPSDATDVILDAARGLLALSTPLILDSGCTLVGVSLSNLANAGDALQLELPFGARGARRVDRTVDAVRDRFGPSAITRGVLLGRDQGMTVPLLPD